MMPGPADWVAMLSTWSNEISLSIVGILFLTFLRTAARCAAGVALEAGAVSNERELSTFHAGVAFVPLLLGNLDRRVGQCLAPQLHLVRDIPVTMAVSSGSVAGLASCREDLGADPRWCQYARVNRLAIHTLRILRILLDGIHSQIIIHHLLQIVTTQVGDGQLAEDVINDRGGHLDVIIEFDRPVRLEPREQERFHELFQRHTMLEPQRDRDREAVHQAAEGRALLVHVQEDLPQRPVGILTRPEVELVTADNSFLRVAEPPFRHAPSFEI